MMIEAVGVAGRGPAYFEAISLASLSSASRSNLAADAAATGFFEMRRPSVAKVPVNREFTWRSPRRTLRIALSGRLPRGTRNRRTFCNRAIIRQLRLE